MMDFNVPTTSSPSPSPLPPGVPLPVPVDLPRFERGVCEREVGWGFRGGCLGRWGFWMKVEFRVGLEGQGEVP